MNSTSPVLWEAPGATRAPTRRLGGDEFVAVLPDLGGGADAGIVCRRIIESVRRPIPVQDRELRVGVSIGVAIHPDDGADPETLLRRADAAMYRAKARGKGDVAFFSETESVASLERAAWSALLLSALGKDELGVRFLPRVDAGERLAAVEVVPWWDRSGRGVDPPDEVMHQADRTGLSRVLAERLAGLAFEQMVQWRSRGLDPPVVSLSLCARALARWEFIEQVVGLARDRAIPVDRVEIRFAAEEIERRGREAWGLLQRARDAGFRVALDRFALGTVGLGRLGRLPVDVLHLGELFVRELEPEGEGAAVLSALVSLARGLGDLGIVADGVDSAERLALVRSLGCPLVQGLAVSPPVEADRLAEMIERGTVG